VVTIFGGSHGKEGEPDYEEARQLGKVLAKAGYTVCNGGYAGMMEATARGAKEAGGRTVGVTVEEFGAPANPWIDEEIRMKKWPKRVLKLIELGDAFVLLDGGTGTLVELFVVWEMLNKKLMTKPVLIFGKDLQDLTGFLKKWPRIVFPPKLIFATTLEQILQGIKKK